MLSGVVNQHTWSQLLHGIAQKRKQGVLELTIEEAVSKIFFMQGRIVDVQSGSDTPAIETFKLLSKIGTLGTNPPFTGSDYAELESYVGSVLGQEKSHSQELIRRAVHKKTADFIHNFTLPSSVPWSFRVGGVALPRDIAIPIPTSQLLLDLAEKSPTEERFKSQFPKDTVAKADPGFKARNDFEGIVLDSLRASPLTVQDLAERLILPNLYSCRALLELLESRAITLITQADAAKQTQQQKKKVETPEKAIKIELTKTVQRNYDSHWIPNIVAILFLLAAVTIPIFSWEQVIVQF